MISDEIWILRVIKGQRGGTLKIINWISIKILKFSAANDAIEEWKSKVLKGKSWRSEFDRVQTSSGEWGIQFNHQCDAEIWTSSFVCGAGRRSERTEKSSVGRAKTLD